MKSLQKSIEYSDWHGLYNKTWGDLIPVREAYCHPAKFARGLIFRIVDHLFECGWVEKGAKIIDPFGGVGLGALPCMIRGLDWTGCELESRFVELCNENLRLWRERYGTLEGYGSARILQGDSRRLIEVLSSATEPYPAAVSSPPYARSVANPNDPARNIAKAEESGHTFESMGKPGGQMRYAFRYSDDPNNLGNLADSGFDAAIASPPYVKPPGHGGASGVFDSLKAEKQLPDPKYGDGEADGQIAALPEGDFIAAISSPPFSEDQPCASQSKEKKDYQAFTRGNGTKLDHQAKTEGNLASMDGMSDPEAFDIAVSSPPFADSLASDDPEKRGGLFADPKRRNDKTLTATYGSSDGQLGVLKESNGDFEACVSSPPFASSLATNPPNKETERRRQIARGRNPDSPGAGTDADYGVSDGQLGILKDDGFDASVASPPYESSLDRGVVDKDARRLLARERGLANSEHITPIDMDEQRTREYGNSPNQLGNTSSDTYWSAARLIVEQTFLALRPGGHACWVLKAYVKAGKVVDFPERWRLLCEAVGFKTVHIHRAWLVEEHAEQGGLFGESQIIKSEKMSFFRRLHSNKYPHLAIRNEIVLCLEKPGKEGTPME